jgi:hypothetical protein
MSTETLPLDLCKAHVGLQLQITRLLQESGHAWLEAAQQSSAAGMTETANRIESLSNLANWQALVTLPSGVFWRVFQGRLNDARTTHQIAMRNQAAFLAGLQQALGSWQEAVLGAFGEAANTAHFADALRQWAQPWAPNAAAGQGKTRK